MCMIIYKPAGCTLPSETIMTNIALRNSHGIGFMFPKDGNVEIYKMKMSAGIAYKLLQEIDQGMNNDEWLSTPLVIHFRLATHGAVDDGMCHPFPITDDDELLTARYCRADVGLAHNGVIDIYDPNLTWRQKNELSQSDTYLLVKRYLHKFKFETFKAAYELLDKEVLKFDRLIVMDGDGEVIQWGSWYKNESDKSKSMACEYSNFIHDDGQSLVDYDFAYGYGGGFGCYSSENAKWKQAQKEWEWDEVDDVRRYESNDHEIKCELCDAVISKLQDNSVYTYEDTLLCHGCFQTVYMNNVTPFKVVKREDGEVTGVLENIKQMWKNNVLEIPYQSITDTTEDHEQCAYCTDLVHQDDSITIYYDDDASMVICDKCYRDHDFHRGEIMKLSDMASVSVGANMQCWYE